MTSITGGSLGPIIPQEPSSIVPQEPMPLITPQGVIGGPSPNIAHGSMISQESGQMLPQGSGSVIPSQNIQIIPQGSSPMNPTQGTQMMPQFAGIVPQASDCVSACMPACSVPCARQNLATSQAIGSLVYVTPPSTYVPNPGKVEPATQQPTKECLAACMQQCNAQCIQNQPQPLPLTPEPVPIQSQATSIPTQFRASVHLQPLVTECLPSATIEIECVCPRGFIVCVVMGRFVEFVTTMGLFIRIMEANIKAENSTWENPLEAVLNVTNYKNQTLDLGCSTTVLFLAFMMLNEPQTK
uniref:Phospholipid scramblase n=1 Tax=Ascaris lumbricoides TaxID=6252 RepID=A0A0M3IM48_ASCLU